MMQISDVTDLYGAVSHPRLEKYRSQGGSDLEMITNYCWNVELAESLYPVLAALEVTLRNSIHSNLAVRENTERWFWNVLRQKDLPDFEKTVTRLRRRLRTEPTAGQIVAEQSFGFWTMMLGQNYNQIIWTQHRAALIHTTFPYLPPTPNARKHLERHYRLLQELRNRVMHFEPIWRGVYRNQQIYALPDLHARITDGIGWINPTMPKIIQLSDRFGDIYQTGQKRIESDIKQRFGIS